MWYKCKEKDFEYNRSLITSQKNRLFFVARCPKYAHKGQNMLILPFEPEKLDIFSGS
jgi:hypothetical protein